MSLRRAFVALGLLSFVSAAHAGYMIEREDGGNNTLVQGREYSYVVRSNPAIYDSIDLRATGALADYSIFVGAGVQIGPNEFRVDASGELHFIVRYHKA